MKIEKIINQRITSLEAALKNCPQLSNHKTIIEAKINELNFLKILISKFKRKSND